MTNKFVQGNINSSGQAKYVSSAIRRDFPPFSDCYVAEMPLKVAPMPISIPVRDSKSPTGYRDKISPGKPFVAQIWAEKSTGRIVWYFVSWDYDRAKGLEREDRPGIGNLISKEKAVVTAKTFLANAGISVSDMRMSYCYLNKAHLDDMRCANYAIVFKKYVIIPQAGEVELPVTGLFDIDALTGELNSYTYKEYPVTIELVAPKYSREQCLEIAKDVFEKHHSSARVDKIDASLKVDFDLSNLNKDELELQDNDSVKFYQEVQSKRQVLAWEFVFRRGEGLLDFRVTVDANTGKCISFFGSA